MTSAMRRIAGSLLLLFAFFWPWNVYAYVPWGGAYATDLIGWALIGLLAADCVTTRQLRIPFELLWPPVVLLVFVGLPLARGNAGVSGAHVAAILVYAATVHWARSREGIAQCLALSCLSGTGAAVWTFVALSVPLLPTAYSLRSGAALAFARDLAGGALTLALCFVMAAHYVPLVLASSKRRGTGVAALVAGGVLLATLGVFLVGPLREDLPAVWRPPAFGELPRVTIASLLVLLWLASRIAAKAHVRYGDSSYAAREPATPGMASRRTLTMLTVGIWVGVVFCLCFPVRPTMAHGFLLGLASAYTLPAKELTSPSPRWRFVLLLPCAALIATNLVRVYPSNRIDPRNYDVAAQADFDAGQLDTLARRMDLVESFAPRERQPHLWRARGELVLGYVHRAAYEFREALEAVADHQILPPPSVAEKNDFLVRLRDACSSAAKPERLFAYEYALVAAGETEQALDSLWLRAQVPTEVRGELRVKPLAEAIAFLLDDRPLATALCDRPPADLLTLLGLWGATIERAPEGFPGDRLPLVLAARAAPDGVAVVCLAGAADPVAIRVPARQPLGRPRTPARGWEGAGWTPLMGVDGGWSIRLDMPGGGETVTARFGQTGEVVLEPVGEARGEAPDLPALRVYVP